MLDPTKYCFFMRCDHEPINDAHPTLQTLLDFGTGSGILAIAGHVLGCSNVVGVDIDDDALEAAASNINRNSIPDGTVRRPTSCPLPTCREIPVRFSHGSSATFKWHQRGPPGFCCVPNPDGPSGLKRHSHRAFHCIKPFTLG
jgi:ribosomal protein L11 methylase PrmA